MICLERRLVVFLSCVIVGADGSACDTTETLSNSQIRHLQEIVNSTQADSLDQATAIETLMCDKRSTMRSLAIDVALSSKVSFVRSKILAEILFHKQAITIVFVPEKNLTSQVKEWLTENPGLSIPFTSYDRSNSCIGLYYDDCRRTHVLDISGTAIDLRYGDSGFGRFVLDDDDKLVGEYFPKNLGSGIPAQIRIH